MNKEKQSLISKIFVEAFSSKSPWSLSKEALLPSDLCIDNLYVEIRLEKVCIIDNKAYNVIWYKDLEEGISESFELYLSDKTKDEFCIEDLKQNEKLLDFYISTQELKAFVFNVKDFKQQIIESNSLFKAHIKEFKQASYLFHHDETSFYEKYKDSYCVD